MTNAKVIFHARKKTWEVSVPVGTTILEASKECNAPEGDACGGVCGCSTCHVYVARGAELLSGKQENEEDIMDKAFDVKANSRLGCQATIEHEGTVECEIAEESLDAYFNEHPRESDFRKG